MAFDLHRQIGEIEARYKTTPEVGDFTLNQEPQYVPLSPDVMQPKEVIPSEPVSTIPVEPAKLKEDTEKYQAQDTVISGRVLTGKEYLDAPMTKPEEWALRMADKTWMPWGWEAFLRSTVKRRPPIQVGEGGKYGAIPRPTTGVENLKSAGYLAAGAAEGFVKAFNTVYAGVDRTLRTASLPILENGVLAPIFFTAAFDMAMTDKEWNNKNLKESISIAGNATNDQLIEMFSKIDPEDIKYTDLLPPSEDIREKAFQKLKGAKNPIERGAIIVEAILSAAPVAEGPYWSNKAFFDLASSPAFILWYKSGRIHSKPPIKVTPEGVANSRRIFGLGPKYNKAQVEKISNSMVNTLTDNVKVFAKDRLALYETLETNSKLASARSYLLNTTTDINLAKHTNMFQRVWSVLKKPIWGEVAPKYKVIPFHKSMSFNQASNLRSFMNRYKVSDEWLNYQARMATGTGKSTIAKYNSGMNLENLDATGAGKLLTRINNLTARFPDDFAKGKPVLFDKYTELPDLAKRLPNMPEIMNYVNNGKITKAIQASIKQSKGLFNMRAIMPELYSSAMDGNIASARLSTQSITQLNKIFTDKGIYKGSKISKQVFHAISQKNPVKYLTGLYNKGKLTLQEYKNASSATKGMRHFYDEWAKMIEPIAKRYGIKFVKEQRYQPQYIVKTLQDTLNQAKATRYMTKELQGGWILNDATIGDASLPISLKIRMGNTKYIDDAVEVAERYAHSMSKWIGLQPFDNFAQQAIPQLPKNLQQLAVKYVKHMRGYPGSESPFWGPVSKGAAKLEYLKWVGYSSRAMLKNATQTIHDLANIVNPSNYIKAWKMYRSPEGKKIIEQMGLQYVNISRGNFVGKSNILQKVTQDGAYYLWQANQSRNYSISGLSHYYDALEKGLNHSQSLQYGLQHGIQSQYAYNRAGSLIIDILQPTAGRFFLFKKWALSQAQMFTEWAASGNQLAIARYLMEVDILSTQMEKVGISMRPGLNTVWNFATRGPLKVGVQEAQEIWKTIQLAKAGKKPIPSDLVSQFVNNQLGKFFKFYEESQWDWRSMNEMRELTQEGSFKDSAIDLLFSSSKRADYWEGMKKERLQDAKNQRRVNITKVAFNEWINSVHFNIDPEKWDEKALEFIRTMKQQGIEIGIDIQQSELEKKMREYPKDAKRRFWDTLKLRTKIQAATGQI